MSDNPKYASGPTTKKGSLPIEFSTCKDVESLVLRGIGIEPIIPKKEFVLSLIAVCKRMFEDDVELAFDLNFDLFLMISSEMIMKIEFDRKGLCFVPTCEHTAIDKWLDKWTHDLRVIYFVGNVLQILNEVCLNKNESKKDKKKK